jgi:hypothetical protein
MPVRIPGGWWTVAENSLARAWENSLTGVGQFELVGVLRLRNRSAARSSCSAQDDKSSSFAVTRSPQLSTGEGCCFRLLELGARFRRGAKTQGPSTPLRSGRDDRVIASLRSGMTKLLREGVAQADRGEFIEEEEMDARIERMLCS